MIKTARNGRKWDGNTGAASPCAAIFLSVPSERVMSSPRLSCSFCKLHLDFLGNHTSSILGLHSLQMHGTSAPHDSLLLGKGLSAKNQGEKLIPPALSTSFLLAVVTQSSLMLNNCSEICMLFCTLNISFLILLSATVMGSSFIGNVPWMSQLLWACYEAVQGISEL